MDTRRSRVNVIGEEQVAMGCGEFGVDRSSCFEDNETGDRCQLGSGVITLGENEREWMGHRHDSDANDSSKKNPLWGMRALDALGGIRRETGICH